VGEGGEGTVRRIKGNGEKGGVMSRCEEGSENEELAIFRSSQENQSGYLPICFFTGEKGFTARLHRLGKKGKGRSRVSFQTIERKRGDRPILP